MTYAKGTEVSAMRSRVEIEQLLQKYGATSAATAYDEHWATVMFVVGRWAVRMRTQLPRKDEFAEVRSNQFGDTRKRSAGDQQRAWEQACREKWRALHLALKAKFVSLEGGVETFEEAFLAHLVLKGGNTVGQKALPAMREQSERGDVPSLPPFLGADS